MGADGFDYDEEYDGGGCYARGGSGWIIACIDDMCRGAGECMHGDGEDNRKVCNADFHKDTC